MRKHARRAQSDRASAQQAALGRAHEEGRALREQLEARSAQQTVIEAEIGRQVCGTVRASVRLCCVCVYVCARACVVCRTGCGHAMVPRASAWLANGTRRCAQVGEYGRLKQQLLQHEELQASLAAKTAQLDAAAARVTEVELQLADALQQRQQQSQRLASLQVCVRVPWRGGGASTLCCGRDEPQGALAGTGR
jgi:hypothetical protein